MKTLSPKQREIRQRQEMILKQAREMLLGDGYYGITMDGIAKASDCPKGTIYQQFGCKEDIVIALAAECMERSLAMIQRAADYRGRARERVVAIGESFSLYSRLNMEDFLIMQNATGPVRQKASLHRLEALGTAEDRLASIIRRVIRDGFDKGDLKPSPLITIEQLSFALWSLVQGSYNLASSGVIQSRLQLENPTQELWWVFNRLADAYGWRPLYAEQDWEETLARIRRTIFPKEAESVYGKDAWYGDAGTEHPDYPQTLD